jgi:hypothetical protein
MSNGFTVKEAILYGASVSCLASSTTPVTTILKVSGADSLNQLVRVTVSAITVTNAIAVVLQDSPDGSTWSTVKTTALSATTNYELELNVHNGSDTAMWPMMRVVVTTGVGDTATISSCLVTRRL